MTERERLTQLAAQHGAAYCFTCGCLTILPSAHEGHDCVSPLSVVEMNAHLLEATRVES